MTRQVIVRPLAEQDIAEAQSWYEEKNPRVAIRFRDAVNNVLQLLRSSPLIFPTAHRGVRRASLKGFPYLLYYAVRSESIVILGCFHARRNPRIALRRIEREL